MRRKRVGHNVGSLIPTQNVPEGLVSNLSPVLLFVTSYIHLIVKYSRVNPQTVIRTMKYMKKPEGVKSLFFCHRVSTVLNVLLCFVNLNTWLLRLGFPVCVVYVVCDTCFSRRLVSDTTDTFWFYQRFLVCFILSTLPSGYLLSLVLTLTPLFSRVGLQWLLVTCCTFSMNSRDTKTKKYILYL